MNLYHKFKEMDKPCNETLEIFGRILYALAMADGEVQKEEVETLREVVSKDKWAKEIELSFDMSRHLDMDPKMIFLKNMRVFRTKAAKEHYPYFLNLMIKVASAYNGIVPEEREMINTFRSYFEEYTLPKKYFHARTYLHA